MARFQGNLSKSPAFDTGAPVKSAKNWTKYIVGVGMMASAITLATNVVSPRVNQLLNRASGGRVNAGNAPWEGW